MKLSHFERWNSSDHKSAPYWIVSTSHVCHHWRDVALAYPGLWSRIDFTQPRWADEMLKRSLGPLVIETNFDYMPPRMLGSVRAAMKHTPRIRKLLISTRKESMEELLSSAVSLDATLLESLCLLNSSNIEGSNSPEKFNIPGHLFSGASRLRHIELSTCHIDWESPLFSGLKHLKLHGIDPRPTMSQLIQMLEKMPHLKTLDLEDCLPTIPVNATTSTLLDRVSVLPCLSHLRLSSKFTESVALLKHLSYPSSTSLVLDYKSSPDDNVFDMLSALSEMNEIREKDIHTLTIDAPNTKVFRMQASTFNDPSSPDSQAAFTLSWTQIKRRQEALELLPHLCNILSIAHLDTLDVDHAVCHLPRSLFSQTFAHLPELKIIHRDSAHHGALAVMPSTWRRLR